MVVAKLSGMAPLPPKGTVWIVIEPGSRFALVYEIIGDKGEAREMVGEIVSERSGLFPHPAPQGLPPKPRHLV